jgi:hypothetical protein
MTSKQRLSASVDVELLEAAQAAVAEGRATSISAWVNDALTLKAEHDRRMHAFDSFLHTYEADRPSGPSGPLSGDGGSASARQHGRFS